jgi:plastocyanin
MTGRTGLIGFLAAALISASACGGSDSPSSPSGGGNDGTIAATVTITASGVSPKSVTIPIGSRVTFVNNDTRTHDINSNPHPNHGSCPSMDGVLNMAPGQNRTTNNFTAARTCGYHDHNDDTNPLWQGTVVVQ